MAHSAAHFGPITLLDVRRAHHEHRRPKATGIHGARSSGVWHSCCPGTLDGDLGASTVGLRRLVHRAGHSLACASCVLLASAQRRFDFGSDAPRCRSRYLAFTGWVPYRGRGLSGECMFGFLVALAYETGDSEICRREEGMKSNHPAPGKAGIASRLAIEHHCPSLAEPGRSEPHMKLGYFTAFMLLLATPSTRGEYADSVWLDYRNGLAATGDVIMTDIRVEVTALYTYYAGLVWNNGYMGLQRGGSGYFKHVHFSVWDPSGGGFADLVWADDDVVTERFGGEGTGWKAMWPLNWNDGETYRLCVSLTHTNSTTLYDAYFFNPVLGKWKHLATFRRPDALHAFSYVASFVEDFGNTLSSRRSCVLGNAWLRTFSNNWIDLRTANYATSGSKTNKDADVVGDMFRLETGGNTTNDTPAYTQLTRSPAAIEPTNQDLTIEATASGQSLLLRWQTLPWRVYLVGWTTNLVSWPDGQQQATISNTWTELITSNQVKFFRMISSE